MDGTHAGTVLRPHNPTTLEPLGPVRAATPAEVDDAAARAAAAFAGRWPVDARHRARVLFDWAYALGAHSGELAAALVAETGKPVTEARQEVAAAVNALLYNAGLARHIGGAAGTLSDGTVAHLVREPVGVTAFVVPWNWPVLLLLRDLAPALAAGVTALVKPAPQGTFVTERVLELGRRAGLPPDVVRLLPGGVETGRAVVAHPLVRAVAFTGSTAVGAAILRSAADRMKRPLLELGGKGAIIVCADADVPAAVAAAVAGATVTAGQMCMACTRVLVDRRRYAEVRERLAEGLAGVVVGDPAAGQTRMGPLISPAAGQRLAGYLRAARQVTDVSGGERLHLAGLAGYFVRPALVDGPALDSPVVQQELFAPVVTLEPFDGEDQALRRVNATPYGLAAGVWTRDVHRAWRLARGVDAGTVWVNGYNHSYPELPSGGVKASGLGRTRGVAGFEQFTELKHVHFTVAGAEGAP